MLELKISQSGHLKMTFTRPTFGVFFFCEAACGMVVICSDFGVKTSFSLLIANEKEIDI